MTNEESDAEIAKWWADRPEEYKQFLLDFDPMTVGAFVSACEYVGRAAFALAAVSISRKMGLDD